MPIAFPDINQNTADAETMDITHSVSGSEKLLLVCVVLEVVDSGKDVLSVVWDPDTINESLGSADHIFSPSHGKLQIEIEPEDEEHALSVIETHIVQMDIAEIRELRDATEELLGWWQTDSGLQESLHIYQWGDVNTAGGRMAIRQAREDLKQEEIGPFRSFFQTINLVYQKKNQEKQVVLRQKRLRQQAGLE